MVIFFKRKDIFSFLKALFDVTTKPIMCKRSSLMLWKNSVFSKHQKLLTPLCYTRTIN